MMKLLLTWKDQNTEEFKQNKKRVMQAFAKWGLRSIPYTNLKTEIVGSYNESDYTRIWGCLNEDLLQYHFFYNCVAECIWFDNEPKEDVVETGMELIKEEGLVMYD